MHSARRFLLTASFVFSPCRNYSTFSSQNVLCKKKTGRILQGESGTVSARCFLLVESTMLSPHNVLSASRKHDAFCKDVAECYPQGESALQKAHYFLLVKSIVFSPDRKHSTRRKQNACGQHSSFSLQKVWEKAPCGKHSIRRKQNALCKEQVPCRKQSAFSFQKALYFLFVEARHDHQKITNNSAKFIHDMMIVFCISEQVIQLD